MRKKSGLRVAWLCLAVGLCSWRSAEGELVLLVTLTRHGSRAPNPVIDELCPANAPNRAKYNVPPGQLTEIGMQQAFKLGTFLRETYVESMAFLPPTLGSGSDPSFSSKFMSDPAERCLQTAQAMAMGLFPNGTGPPGFSNQPVAVETEQKQYASMLAAAHGVCLPQQKADNAEYDATRGRQLIEQSRNITDVIALACGTPTEYYDAADNGKEGLVLGVKDVGDMLDFDEQQGLPRLSAVSRRAHRDMTQLAFTLLQERYYSNKRQVTYWAGDWPTTLLDDLRSAATRHSNRQEPKRLYLGYHGHRELLYGVAHLLGWNFNVQGAPTALGTSSIPPATTMFFELHYHSEEVGGSSAGTSQDQKFYVRTYTWTPDFGQQEVVLDACKDVDAGKGCPLSTIEAVVENSARETGSWMAICHHVPFDQAEKMAQGYVFGDDDADGEAKHSADGSGGNKFLSLLMKLSIVPAIAAGLITLWFVIVAAKSKWQGAGGRGGGSTYEVVA